MVPLLVATVFCFSFDYRYICNLGLDDGPKVKIDSHMLGRWKITEDPDNGSYLMIGQFDLCQYKVTYVNGRGAADLLVENTAYFSKMSDTRWLNLAMITKYSRGYVLFQVPELDSTGGKMTLTQVTDTSLGSIDSRQALRVLVTNNLATNTNFGTVIHLYKVDSSAQK